MTMMAAKPRTLKKAQTPGLRMPVTAMTMTSGERMQMMTRAHSQTTSLPSSLRSRCARVWTHAHVQGDSACGQPGIRVCC